MKKILSLYVFCMIMVLVCGCSTDQAVGNYFGIPGFILDPILYAEVDIDGNATNLNLQRLYVVQYTDASGTAIDNSLWIFFVTKKAAMADILAGDASPAVILKINDVNDVTVGTHISITSDLASSNYMVWLDRGDGKALYEGESIELDVSAISNVKLEKVQGEFAATLKRGGSTAEIRKFKFDAKIGTFEGAAPVL
jgi:hypothetical protein